MAKAKGKINVECVWCDLGDKTQLELAWQRASTRGQVHLLINNAAIAKTTAFIELPADDYEETIRVNLLAPVRLTKFFMNSLVHQDKFHGRIVNIVSVAGMQGCTAMNNAEYSASKAALASFADSLRQEIWFRHLPVSILNIYPYIIDTQLFAGFSGKALYLIPTLRQDQVAR